MRYFVIDPWYLVAGITVLSFVMPRFVVASDSWTWVWLVTAL